MDPSIAASTFALLFVAEMGDKTQLMTMTLAHRFALAPVVGGVFAAFALLNLIAVTLGDVLFVHVPRHAVLLAAGVLFLVFAWRAWRDARAAQDGGDEVRDVAGGAFVTSFVLLFVAELGDKTQIAMVAMAAGSGAPWSVFAGGTAALWAVALLGVLLGRTVLRRVPAMWMHRVAAALFALFGTLALARAVAGGGAAAPGAGFGT